MTLDPNRKPDRLQTTIFQGQHVKLRGGNIFVCLKQPKKTFRGPKMGRLEVKGLLFYQSKNFPTDPWSIPQTPNQQFVKEFLSFGGERGCLGYAPGVCGVSLRISFFVNGGERVGENGGGD